MIEYTTIGADLTYLWHDAMYVLNTYGTIQHSRVGDTLEVLSYKATLTNIDQNFVLSDVRKADPAYAAAEMLWYLSNTTDTTMLQHYAPSYKKFTEDGVHAYGAYGPRTMDNIPKIIKLLQDHPNTRQAVLVFWKHDDIDHAHKVNDIPCSIMLQFLLRDGRLNCIAYMRSNDVWLGMPYDIFCFTMIQRMIADMLGVEYGHYVHNVGSLHLYTSIKDKYGPVDYIGAPRLSHNWAKHKLDDTEMALSVEIAARKSRSNLAYSSDNRRPLMDLASVCIKKNELKHESAFVDNFRITSPILSRAWELKYEDV